MPGIEIDFEHAQLLLISKNEEIIEFNNKCEKVKNKTDDNCFLAINDLKEIFGELDKYLLIPHYKKDPKVKLDILNQLKDYIFAGEVSSPKKFYSTLKEKDALTPCLFSDFRAKSDAEIKNFEGRQTFIKTDSNMISIDVIKCALMDKLKVSLSEFERDGFFQVFSNPKQNLYNGLNVILGGRSSGKTHFLNQLNEIFHRADTDVKYIKQFSLIKEGGDNNFESVKKKYQEKEREKYLSEFKGVLNEVDNIIDLDIDTKIDKYMHSLVEYANNTSLHDQCSRAKLSTEETFNIDNLKELEKLIDSVIAILGEFNGEYKSAIETHIKYQNLYNLFCNLVGLFNDKKITNEKMLWLNTLIVEIKNALSDRSSAPRIEHDDEVKLYGIQLQKIKLKKFDLMARNIKKKKNIYSKNLSNKFKIQVCAKPYEKTIEMKNNSLSKKSFAQAFAQYTNPLEFLKELKKIDGFGIDNRYKLFCNIECSILNSYNKDVSGGEMAEFNFLSLLKGARKYELLLIDEPESSFDNIFLKESIINIIKEISRDLPVVLVTHNNTVGISINPDYIIYTKREIIEGQDVYKIFSCCPGEKELVSSETGEKEKAYKILLDSLEAGDNEYTTRMGIYNNYKSENIL